MKSFEILYQHFIRKKELNPGYSLRALARDIKVSPAFISNIVKGKKKIPFRILQSISKTLDFDDNTITALKTAIVLESVHNHKFYSDVQSNFKSSVVQKFKPLSNRKISLLQKWQYVAVLDLIECKNFKNNPNWIAKQLGLMQTEAEEAIEVLHRLGLIEPSGSTWRKKQTKIRLPTNHSRDEIRKFHKQMIEKALVELQFKTEQSAFEKRLIAGITFAANPKKIKKAKRKLEEAIHEIMSELMDGNCTEVYQMNYQFFPLTVAGE